MIEVAQVEVAATHRARGLASAPWRKRRPGSQQGRRSTSAGVWLRASAKSIRSRLVPVSHMTDTSSSKSGAIGDLE